MTDALFWHIDMICDVQRLERVLRHSIISMFAESCHVDPSLAE